jgi:opacity protein-like surface antigen
MTKKLLAIALGTAATISVAHAAPPTFYAGGDIAGFTSKIEDKTGIPPNESGSAKATTLRLRGGMHILDWLDAEMHIVLPQDKDYSTNNKVKTSVVGLFAKPNYNVGPVNLYGLVGFAQSKMDFSGSLATGSQTESGVAYGVGVQYPFTRNLSGSIDYVQYLKKSNFGGVPLDVTNSAISAGVLYTFK